MRVLVLGGNGFIGSHIVDELLNAGHSVSVYDRNPEIWRKPLTGVTYYYGDFSDTNNLTKALHSVDAVIHLLSTTVPSTSNLDPIADINDNLVNTVRLIDLMVKNKIKRILFLSSAGTVYGIPNTMPVQETHSLNPICSYGVVKVAIEKYLGMFSHAHDLKPMIIRPSNPYGPRQSHLSVQGIIPIFMDKILKGKEIEIWGDGSVKRDYIYVSDLAKLCLVALESNECEVLNAGSGQALSLAKILELIESQTSKKAKVEYLESRWFDINEIALDITKAKTLFDWEPCISIEEGLKLHHEWLKTASRVRH